MKSYRVKLNETGKYFEVSFAPMDTIEHIKMVDQKEDATIFQPDANIIKLKEGDFLHKIYNDCFGVSEIKVGNQRMAVFSLALQQMGLKREHLTIEEFDAPEQSPFSKTQQEEIKEDMKVLDEFEKRSKTK